MLLENQSQWSMLTDQQRNAECEKRIKQCEKICSKKYSQYVCIFDIDDESTDLDSAILELLLKSISGSHVSMEELQHQLNLSFQWDRLDIAEKYIFNKKTNFPRQFIKNIMRKAILNGQYGFISLLMKDLKLSEYANIDEVFELYIEAATHKIVKRFTRSPTSRNPKARVRNFSGIVERLYRIIGNFFEIDWINYQLYNAHYNKKALQVKIVEEDIPKLDDPAFFFFVLAILMLKHELAEFFLMQCKDTLSSGLIGMKLCQCLIDSNIDLTPDEEEDVREIYMELKTITYRLFDIMNEENELEAAQFLAHPMCQLVLKSAWSGALIPNIHMDIRVVISILLPILSIFLFDFHSSNYKDGAYYLLNMTDPVDNEIAVLDGSNRTLKISLSNTPPTIHKDPSFTSELRRRMGDQRTIKSKMKGFYDAPITKFWISSILFLGFVGLLTYIIIGILPKYPNATEILIVIYMVFYTFAEGREMVSGSHGLLRNAKIWSDGGWNRLDFTIIVLFWIPAVLEFTVVWIVFMLSFGIGQYAVFYPQSQPTPYSLLNVIYYPFWQTFGELHLKDAESVINTTSNCTGPDCPFLPEIGIMFLIGYTVAGNIVLLNLLIAVFNNIYEDIRDKADLLYWSNLLGAVEEFNKPLLPPILRHISVLIRRAWKFDTTRQNGSIVSTEGQPTNFVKNLMLFQAHCSDVYLIDKDREKCANTDAKISNLSLKLAETQANVYKIKEKLDHKLQSLESGINEILEILKSKQ